MANLAFGKKVFTYYERFYQEDHDRDFKGMVVMNNELKKQVMELRQRLESKNKEVVDKNKEIISKDKEIVDLKTEMANLDK